MIRTDKKPKDHYEGRWEKGKKYSLFAVVDNNGTKFRSITAKPKPEPYVSYDSETGGFYANEGWVIAEMSEDSRISALGGNGGGGGGSSSGSMGEDEEYTIAQALNDLNERIEGLQGQIAQQDYLRFGIANPDELTAEEKAEIQKCVQNGTIWDAVIVIGTPTDPDQTVRVVSISESDRIIVIANASTESLLSISYD